MMDRREFIKLSALTVMGGQILHAHREPVRAEDSIPMKGDIPDTEVKAMDFEVTFDTEIINPPKHGKPVRIWMPLSHSSFDQDVTQLSIDSPVAFHINQEPRYGNKMIYVGPAHLKKGDRIAVRYKIHRRTVNIIKDKDDAEKHLILSDREEGNEDIRRFTDKVVAGKKDSLEIGRMIYYALIDLLTYDTGKIGCGPGISVLTFENKGGRCADFHALFRTMMAYKGIPVRWRQGILLPYPSEKTWKGELGGDCPGTHCWSEFYIGDNRWVPVDLIEGGQKKAMRDYFFGTLSPNRFSLSTGRDIVLSPPQEGDPLNTFPVTYGEYEGIPLIYGHHYVNNIGYKVLNVEV